MRAKPIMVTSREVTCSGGDSGGHPKVYLNMGSKDEIACNYCGQIFKLDPEAPVGGSH